jgi:hypothetical protein
MLNYQRIIIIHLANDGYLYFNPDDLTFIQRDPNSNSGWKVFKTGLLANMVKEKLCDFREFTNAWFGTPEIHMSVLGFTTQKAAVLIFAYKPRTIYEHDPPL